jgi:hypothetical protein
LFSSIVASFIIELYKTLLPGNTPQTHGVRINIVLFLSFFLSIMSAISCALIQQWCDEYLNFAYPQAAPHDRGRVRTYLFQGLEYFQMRRFMYGTYVLLHISVFLFFLALSDFFYTVNHLFGLTSLFALVVTAMIYTLLSISPLIFSNSPYNTPMTPPLRASFVILRIIIRSPLWCLRRCRSENFDLTGLEHYKGIHFDRAHLYQMEAKKRAKKLESYAMKWLFTENDFSDDNMDKFLEGLPGYMSSSHTEKSRLDQDLSAAHILNRIKEHFISCATSVGLPDEASIARVDSCVKALVLIFQYRRKDKEPDMLEKIGKSQRTYIQEFINYSNTLYGMQVEDPTIALRAACIRALAVQGLLTQLTAQDHSRKTDTPPVPVSTDTPSPPFPNSLVPIYEFFFSKDNTDTIHLDDGDSPEVKGVWKNLLYDGPLANLTMLAQAIRDKEHAPTSTLSFCWKALDILLTHLGTFHSKGSTPAQSVFDDLRKEIRTYVHEERGFRVTPLLNTLDTVARGRRLLMVFSGHPKYHNRADVVFGKEYLRNGDLLEAFAHCLPGFISKNKDSPGVCKDFMEEVVREDHLWASLQENLKNTQRSDSPTPDKLRVFEDCCTVIDIAFSVLENSQDVDWRAPEFGSLAQHFELFIAHCFQGAFMGRATSFRVGIIKARFCKALLSQFQRDIDHEGTISFRSQWDVASLARLICTLGLRDKEDPEFWNSYVDGGYIGAEFTAKAREMIEITARDGPLLIFCVLGHLTASAVPLVQSDLKHEDIDRVWELQMKLIDGKRVPWDRTSDTVQEKVRQLRNQVEDLLRGKDIGKDKEILDNLLRMIDGVFPGSEGPSQSGPPEEHGRMTPSSGESRGINNRPTSLASESTAVSGGSSSGAQSGEGEGGFEGASHLLIPRPSIDFKPERSANKDLNLEKKPFAWSDSLQSDSGSHSLPSPPLTAHGAPSVGIVNQSIGASPAMHFPYIGDARQRPSTRRTGSGTGATRPGLSTRASTSALLASRRYGSFELSDEGQSGAAPSSSPPNTSSL